LSGVSTRSWFPAGGKKGGTQGERKGRGQEKSGAFLLSFYGMGGAEKAHKKKEKKGKRKKKGGGKKSSNPLPPDLFEFLKGMKEKKKEKGGERKGGGKRIAQEFMTEKIKFSPYVLR